jgi:sugar phosphate isomerase/epimerase
VGARRADSALRRFPQRFRRGSAVPREDVLGVVPIDKAGDPMRSGWGELACSLTRPRLGCYRLHPMTTRLEDTMKPLHIKRGVSIYSFQEKYYRGEMTLEDCIATAAKLGVHGIEMLADQMLPGYPSITYKLSDSFVGQWHEWMSKYGIEPVSFDVYGETKLYKNRRVSHQELVSELVELTKTAHALGFKILRLTFHLPIEVVEAMIPHAEERGMKLALEVHAPHLLTGEWVQRNIELALRTNTKNLGLMPDLGIFCKSIPRLVVDEAMRDGATPRIVDFLSDVYRWPAVPKDLMQQVEKMGANEADLWLAQRIVIGVWRYHDPKNLLRYMPYTFHIHGKFYEMTPDLIEPQVAYEAVLPVLIEGGYDGYIMSEYEGQRLTHGIDMGYDEVEQVRRHQTMLANYLGH